MISLYHTTDNPYSLYGIHHFIEKSGIPVEINKTSSSGIVISYGGKPQGSYVISVQENEIQNLICGSISQESDKIPLCEIPHETGTEDEVIASFKNGASGYPCVTRTKQGFTFGIDIFKETGYLLSGHLDTIRPNLDPSAKKELASIPVVDFLENLLFDAILAGGQALQVPLAQKSYWPEGKPFAVCLTHDVDEIKKTYQWISRPLRFLARKDFSGFKGQVSSCIKKIRGTEPYYTYEDIIGIERDLGAKSTYFILKESGNANIYSKKTWYLYGRNRSLQSPEMRSLIRRLSANGDEVAIHGSYFSYRDPLLLSEETRELESILHEKVLGTRQHNLNLEVPATWTHQLSAGLRYDTTLGFKDTIGFRWGTSFPFFPDTQDGPLSLLEIPLIIMDICLESRSNKMDDCLRIADEVHRFCGVLTLLWHPPVFNTQEYTDFRDIYIEINRYCKEKGAWITRARDIYEWLSLRNKNSFSGTYDPTSKTFTLIPDQEDMDHFFTLYLPGGSGCVIRSGNADILRRNGKYVYIKTHNLPNKSKIILGIL